VRGESWRRGSWPAASGGLARPRPGGVHGRGVSRTLRRSSSSSSRRASGLPPPAKRCRLDAMASRSVRLASVRSQPGPSKWADCRSRNARARSQGREDGIGVGVAGRPTGDALGRQERLDLGVLYDSRLHHGRDDLGLQSGDLDAVGNETLGFARPCLIVACRGTEPCNEEHDTKSTQCNERPRPAFATAHDLAPSVVNVTSPPAGCPRERAQRNRLAGRRQAMYRRRYRTTR